MPTFKAKGKISFKKAPRNLRRTVRKSAPKTKKNFVKAVQSVINKNLEDKMAFRSVMDVNFNSGINSAGDVQLIMPSINIGTGDASRVGAQLTCKSLNIHGHILSNLTNIGYSDCRIGVRMMVVSPKGYVGREPAVNNATTWLGQLLKRGATTVGFTGLVTDFYSPINTDVITCHYDKKFYVKTPYVPGTNEGGLSTSGTTKFFKIKIPVSRKILKYDGAVDSGLSPTNFNPFIILGYCHLDNSSPDTLQTQINMSYTSMLKYQDA